MKNSAQGIADKKIHLERGDVKDGSNMFFLSTSLSGVGG